MRVVLQNDNFLDTVCLSAFSFFSSLSLSSFLAFPLSSLFLSLSLPLDTLSMQTTARRGATDDWATLYVETGLYSSMGSSSSARVTANLALSCCHRVYTSTSRELITSMGFRFFFFYNFSSTFFELLNNTWRKYLEMRCNCIYTAEHEFTKLKGMAISYSRVAAVLNFDAGLLT